MTTHTITLARHTAQVVGLMGVLSAVRENMAAEEMAAENQPSQEKNE